MGALELVNISRLMELTEGTPQIGVGLIDGPVAADHTDLNSEQIRLISGISEEVCSADRNARVHGTFIAGMLVGKRGSSAPAIFPGCTLLVRPLFTKTPARDSDPPSATPRELAEAISECISAGARVLNLSLALAQTFTVAEQALEEALNDAARRGVLVVAAAGNQGAIGSTTITHHPWVISAVGCDGRGRPIRFTNLGKSIGIGGFTAPAESITSVGVGGKPLTMSGTSVAVPFITGAIALLWSKFPSASATQIKMALSHSKLKQRSSIVPPLLNAWAAYQFLASGL